MNGSIIINGSRNIIGIYTQREHRQPDLGGTHNDINGDCGQGARRNISYLGRDSALHARRSDSSTT